MFGVKSFLSMLAEPGDIVEQWWSCGTRKNHHPCTPEGERVSEGPLLAGGTLMRNSNFHEFMKSLEGCGLPESIGESGDMRQLVGIEMHVNRKTIKREGLAGAPREDGRAPQTLLCTKILHRPGEKRMERAKPASPAAAASKPAAAPKPAAKPRAAAPETPSAAPSAPAAAAFDAPAVALQVLSNLFEANPQGISLAAARLAANTELVHQYQASLLNRNKVTTLLFENPDWLGGQGVRIEGETLVLAV